MTRLGLAVLWLLHFLPLPLLARLGRWLGLVLWLVAASRRRIARANLRLCFPDLPEADRARLTRAHFQSIGRSLLERGILWWSSEARIRRVVRLKGLAHWQAVAGRPVIWLAPHFVGLDMGGTRLGCDFRLVSVYSRQKNRVMDAMLYWGRTRFGMTELVARQDGIRPIVKKLKSGLPFYYLPDQDYGAKDSVFVPFFGVPAATITGMSRLAKMTGAAVVPCVTRQLPGGDGYELEFHPAWDNFPSGDDVADAARMNAFIEAQVRTMPEQYFWLHRRFKTRPQGAPSLY